LQVKLIIVNLLQVISE